MTTRVTVKQQKHTQAEGFTVTCVRESEKRHESPVKFSIEKSGRMTGEGRILRWEYLFGMGVEVTDEASEDVIAHVDLRSQEAWMSPSVYRLKFYPPLSVREESDLLGVMEGVADYERQGFRLLSASLGHYFRVFEKSGLLPFGEWFESRPDMDIDAVGINLTDYLLQSVLQMKFEGISDHKAIISREDSEVWKYAFDRVMGFIEDWHRADEE